jgi:NADH-quinone oxidoreductase subunit N
MLALLGFPVFGGIGFFAKWYILQAALQAPFPQTRLAVLLVITSLISAGYYLYVVMVMFMKPRDSTASLPEKASGWTRAVVWGSAAVILVFGLFPDAIVSFTRRSTPSVTTVVPVREAPGALPRTTTATSNGAVVPPPDPLSNGR